MSARTKGRSERRSQRPRKPVRRAAWMIPSKTACTSERALNPGIPLRISTAARTVRRFFSWTVACRSILRRISCRRCHRDGRTRSAYVRGQFIQALSSNTGSVSGSLSPTSAGMPGLKMPAFSPAIASRVSPSWAQWSRPMVVTTASSGVRTFVESSRPPRPVSMTATSTPSSANHLKARPVVISKKERLCSSKYGFQADRNSKTYAFGMRP